MAQDKKEKNELWEWVKAILIAVIIVGGIRFFLFEPVMVDGVSMMPTLEDGERIIVNKIGYTLGEPERFDIVVFHASEEEDYVKRIIGLPGDHIAYENDELFINGEAQEEPYLSTLKEQKSEGNSRLTPDFTLEELLEIEEIPEGHVFVLGDNREHSTDSRIIGLVPIEEIMGSASFIFWPLDEMEFVE
ncbi:signal peptidase I [Planomicrobium sp. MB-3u-38]|uniref:signal peptidase I n=1 Tax=Planomicrobium sp. MB-3u-38 TaxID=2058318 RepID=UPI000C7D16FB|nr:signal peptidase I [Planomicrobium sp. MB-3u-38]PKH12168.1 signal peptidase I [Planomicrobium sp. MB-3u-38]